jgi:hypothetical protein
VPVDMDGSHGHRLRVQNDHARDDDGQRSRNDSRSR